MRSKVLVAVKRGRRCCLLFCRCRNPAQIHHNRTSVVFFIRAPRAMTVISCLGQTIWKNEGFILRTYGRQNGPTVAYGSDNRQRRKPARSGRQTAETDGQTVRRELF
jgi:hypothetical protein